MQLVEMQEQQQVVAEEEDMSIEMEYDISGGLTADELKEEETLHKLERLKKMVATCMAQVEKTAVNLMKIAETILEMLQGPCPGNQVQNEGEGESERARRGRGEGEGEGEGEARARAAERPTVNVEILLIGAHLHRTTPTTTPTA